MTASRYKTVLSIDWDFFFPEANSVDGNCRFCSWHKSCKNNNGESLCDSRPTVLNRASAGCRYDQVGSPSRCDFSRFKPYGLTPRRLHGADLFVAECHADIYSLLGTATQVVNFDAHDDYGDHDWQLCCGSWAGQGIKTRKISHYQWVSNYIHDLKEAEHFYSTKDFCESGCLHLPSHFNAVFLCLSRPWTPKSYDRHFARFCHELEEISGKAAVVIGRDQRTLRTVLDQKRRSNSNHEAA
jgi:hypothetical protein